MSVEQKPPCRHYEEVFNGMRTAPAVLTHWDADGILAANKLFTFFPKNYFNLYIPRIGSWSLSAVPQEVNMEESLIVIDYGFPNMHLMKTKLIIVDHHATPVPEDSIVCNPVLEGSWAPSATYVLSSLFGEYDWRDTVSVAADLVNPEQWHGWSKLSSETGVSLDEAKEAASLLNSCYRINDLYCIMSLAERVNVLGLRGVLESPSLRRRKEKVNEYIDKLENLTVCKELERGIYKCYVKTDDERLILVSGLGRRLFKRLEPKEIILIMDGNNMARVYVRGDVLNHLQLIEALRPLALEVGGKKEVCSALLAREKLQKTLEVVLRTLRGEKE